MNVDVQNAVLQHIKNPSFFFVSFFFKLLFVSKPFDKKTFLVFQIIVGIYFKDRIALIMLNDCFFNIFQQYLYQNM